MKGSKELYSVLEELEINFEYNEHPAAPTIEIAKQYWKDLDAVHCKNLFFRNHKGNRHYLVVFDHRQNLSIKSLEQKLKQGKLSFASEKRMDKYLALKPGSVSPFGLIQARENHVMVFFDKNLQKANKISFHPCINTASLVLKFEDFKRFMDWVGNRHEFLNLY